MTRIGVAIKGESSIEIDIDKPIGEIRTSDVYDEIGREKRIMGWCELNEGVRELLKDIER